MVFQSIKEDGLKSIQILLLSMYTCPLETINFNMSVVRRLLWFLLFFHGYTVAQVPSDFYTKKEEQVKKMAAEILKLDAARCGWAANCSTLTCSRHACTPIGNLKDRSIYNFTCKQQIEPNPYCSSSTGSCNYRQVNYAMSYVRMPIAQKAFTSHVQVPVPDEMCSTICMTRDFTSTMKALAFENDHVNDFDELFYFASIDGVFRIYPGEEKNGSKCYNFDPRKRSWYNGAISLQTYLIVLIDNSIFANDETPSPLSDNVLTIAKGIVQKILYTTCAGDMLDVITFNEKNATALMTKPVRVQDDREAEEFDDGRKDLTDLINKIAITQDISQPSYGGFVEAISTALQRSNAINVSLNQVILVFTNGWFASDLQLADRQPVSRMLKSNSTKLFIYSFAISSNLQALANESDGYYETIVDNFDNPLYQISSFFNFMSLARNASAAYEPHWTMFYNDFEGRGNISTVSYQALSPEGYLVGVVGIDIVPISGEGNLSPKAGYRPTNPNAITDVRTEVRPANNSCGNCKNKEGICERSNKNTFTDLKCCGPCNPKSHKWSAGKIVAEIVVPVVVVLALIVSVAWWLWRRRKQSGIPKPSTTEVGPYQ